MDVDMTGDRKRKDEVEHNESSKAQKLDKVILSSKEFDNKNQEQLQTFLTELDKRGDLGDLVAFVTKENYTGKRFLANWPLCKGYIGEWGIETLLNGLTLGDFAPREKQPPRRFQIEGEVDASKEFFFIPRNSRQVILRTIQGNKKVLIQGPRMSGKTTLLREVTRHLSPEFWYLVLSPKGGFEGNPTLEEMMASASLHPALKEALKTQAITLANIFAQVPKDGKLVVFCDDFDLFSKTAMNGMNSTEVLSHVKFASLVCFATAVLTKDQEKLFEASNTLKYDKALKFERDEFDELFRFFETERSMKFDPKVLDDIFSETGGHAGLIALCGRILEDMLPSAGTLVTRWKGPRFYGRMFDFPVAKQIVAPVLDEPFDSAGKEYGLLKGATYEPGPTMLPDLRKLCTATIPIQQKAVKNWELLVNLGLAVMKEVPVITKEEDRAGVEVTSNLIKRLILPSVFLPNSRFSLEIPMKDGKLDMFPFLALAIKNFDAQAIENSKKGEMVIDRMPKERIYQDQFYISLLRWFLYQEGWSVACESGPTNEGGASNDSVDFLVTRHMEGKDFRAGIELLRGTANKDDIKEHAGRCYPFTHSLDQYVVVNFHQVEDNRNFGTDFGLVNVSKTFEGFQKDKTPSDIPIYYVYHTKAFDRVKLMYRFAENKVHVVTIFGN